VPAESNSSDAVFVPRGGEGWRDPFTMYRALREHDPVHEVSSPDGDYWALSRFEDVLAAATDAETFSSAQGLTFAYGEMEKLPVEAPIVMMDPPKHTALRKVVAKRFTPKRVAALEPMIRDFVVERIERLREQGEGDVVAEVLKPLPSFVVAHFLGVPQDDRSKFGQWTDAIVAANATGDFGGAADAAMDMMGYFAALIEKRKTDPGEDMISSLVHGDIEGQPISMPAMLGFGFTMVTGGNDTTTGLLGGATDLLTRNLDQREILLEEPGRIREAIEEFLRLTSPVQGLARMTTRDVEIGGKTIPADRKVMLLYASANRDDREFGPTAEELDVQRKVKRHLTFSYGPHHCIGAAAARMQARVALEELLSRCPRFVVDGDRGQYAGGHFVRRFESLPFTAEGA
jgi:cytochrome P450